MRTRKPWIFLFLLLVLLLPACSAGGEDPAPESETDSGITTLIYATMHPEDVNRAAINQFNQSHEDTEIVVQDYSETGGWERLTTEIMAGKIPDILDMNGIQLPYRQLAAKGYLEDLWPYIENDPSLGRDKVVETFLRSAEVNGGLYMLFNAVQVDTLVGSEEVVGKRYSWSLAELREALDAMPEGTTVMEYIYPKGDIFFYMGIMCLDSYVDWETGTCSFDSDEFRAFLEFCNQFPQDFSWKDGVEAVNEAITQRRKDGLQMLGHTYISGWDRVPALDAEWGGRAAYVGYPTEDGSAGSALRPSSPCLGMSSTCQNKEAAWSFIRGLIQPRLRKSTKTWQTDTNGYMFFVNRIDYERAKSCAMMEKPESSARKCWLFDGSILPVTSVTEEECQRLEEFLNSIDRIELCDNTIYHIVEDTVGPYFAGDKTLDQTVELIQNRVQLYVDENR